MKSRINFIESSISTFRIQHLFLLSYFQDFLIKVFFSAFDIAGMLIDELAVAVEEESVRRVAHIHGTLEIAVHVEQDVKIPTLAFNDRLHLGRGA